MIKKFGQNKQLIRQSIQQFIKQRTYQRINQQANQRANRTKELQSNKKYKSEVGSDAFETQQTDKHTDKFGPVTVFLRNLWTPSQFSIGSEQTTLRRIHNSLDSILLLITVMFWTGWSRVTATNE